MSKVSIPTEQEILKTVKAGSDYYVAEGCPEHKYDGHGYPKSDSCKRCYEIWKQVHINPGTEFAGM